MLQPQLFKVSGAIPPTSRSQRVLDWRQVNEAIRSHVIDGVDRVFDITEALSQAVPGDNLLMPLYM